MCEVKISIGTRSQSGQGTSVSGNFTTCSPTTHLERSVDLLPRRVTELAYKQQHGPKFNWVPAVKLLTAHWRLHTETFKGFQPNGTCGSEPAERSTGSVCRAAGPVQHSWRVSDSLTQHGGSELHQQLLEAPSFLLCAQDRLENTLDSKNYSSKKYRSIIRIHLK